MNNTEFKIVKKKINKIYLSQIIKIIKSQNNTSVLSKLNFNNILNFINGVIKSNQLDLYLAYNKRVAGYAIIAKKPKYLTLIFEDYKYKFIFDLVIHFNFSTIFNLFLFKIGLENILIPIKEKKIVENSVNLNLLAIDKNYQSKGLGKKFMNFIIKNLGKKDKILSCETDNIRSKNFYIKKLNFREIGKKVRYPIFTSVLVKNLK